ncbi:MAG: DUF3320 domain-containing protein [Phycisphaerales bacterium]
MSPSALDRARDELIDLSNRSRLLNVRIEGKANQLRVVRERSAAVYGRLVGDGSYFDFSALAADEPNSAPPSDDDYADAHLATALDADALERRLLRLAYDDRTSREETGVSSLFLALGFLRWIDVDAGDVARHAPLVLVPVTLERTSARVPFRLRYTGDELPTNLSLQTKLKRECSIEIPDAPDGEDDDLASAIERYFDAVAAAVAPKRGWSVERDEIVLGFFSFAKFLMWRDLDAKSWPPGDRDRPRPDEHPLVAGLLGRAMPSAPAPLCDDDAPLDPLLPPERTGHVVDADSSQAQVVAEAIERRRSLVVQGPPGTGKSQTITNIVAAAVRGGLRVLFVAEKLAALSVVKARLDAVGLGAACLELHSTKATRRGVLDDLARTLDLGPPKDAGASEAAERLRRARETLASHAARLHARDATSGLDAYRAIGELVALESKRAFVRTYALEGAERWTASDLAERLESLGSLAECARRIGVPDAHPWRGCDVDSVLPSELATLPSTLASLGAALKALDAGRSALHAAGLRATTLAHVEIGLAAARLANGRPNCDRAALASDAWGPQLPRSKALAADLATYASERTRLAALVTDQALATDVAALRDELAATGGAWLRRIMPRWRRADAAFSALCRGEAPRDNARRLQLLDALLALRALERSIDERDALGRAAFGGSWAGRAGDAAAIAAIVAWFESIVAAGVPLESARAIAGRVEPIVPTELDAHAARLSSARDAWRDFTTRWKFDPRRAFGVATVDAAPLEAISARVAEWSAAPERVREWIDWATAASGLRGRGMGALVDALAAGTAPVGEIVDDARHAYFQALVRRADADGSLLRTDGADLRRAVAAFRDADEARVRGNRADAAKSHHDRVPQAAQGKGSGLGQVAVILRECAKQRRHLPIRRLLADAGEAVQAIKPVFMMSPLSVSRFLAPGRLAFDVLVVDEASQVRPVEALGAVARLATNATLVIVGDQMQLPPTTFFVGEGGGGDDDDAGDENESLGDLESLLGACEAAGVPRRMLRWHYRSKHHSLIALSNRLFYDARLNVIPSPAPPSATLGLRLHVVQGVYDRGGSRTNRAEARAVAEAVMRHAHETPELSLGAAAFSVQQRDAIIDEIESMRKADPAHEEFFAEGGREPFFVKNLENVQGDERDVILVSVGYGRDKDGGLTMNFGPVSASGGERRLNVLMTRAKRRCEIFSTITADDIDLTRVSGAGPKALKEYLAYARTSGEAKALESRGESTALERSIADALAGAGFACDVGVGADGCVLDVAVRDPRDPSTYVAAIETDGPRWMNARAARDRERIRPAALAERGWATTRVWAVDWWLRRERELQRLVACVQDALAKRAHEPATAPVASAASEGTTTHAVERELPATPQVIALTEPYREASFAVPASKPLDVSEPAFVELVGKVIEIESPIHVAELAKRVASLFRSTRAGAALSERVSHAVRMLASPQARFAAMDGEFVRLASQSSPTPRNRRDVRAAGLKDPAMLPPNEIVELLVRIARANVALTREELIGECRKQLGFGALGQRLREALEAALDEAIAGERLIERDGSLFPREPR